MGRGASLALWLRLDCTSVFATNAPFQNRPLLVLQVRLSLPRSMWWKGSVGIEIAVNACYLNGEHCIDAWKGFH